MRICRTQLCKEVAVVLVSVLFVAIGIAQQADTRSIFVDVLDKKDDSQVNGFDAASFGVTLNGHAIEVISAERVRLKPQVVILLDQSGSMGERTKWNTSIDLAEAVVRNLPGAEVRLVPFSDTSNPNPNFRGIDQALRELEFMRTRADTLARGRTQIRDAVAMSLRKYGLGASDAIVIISDGGDNHSVESAGKMKSDVRKSGARIFSIKLAHSTLYPAEQDSGEELSELCDDSGGGLITIGSEIQGVYAASRGPIFELSEKQQQAIPMFGAQIAARILQPYELKLRLPNNASGKLKVEVVDRSGKKDRNIKAVAADRLTAVPAP